MVQTTHHVLFNMFIEQKEGHGVTGVTVTLTVREAQVLKSVMKDITDMFERRQEKDPERPGSINVKGSDAPKWVRQMPTDCVLKTVETCQKVSVFVNKITVDVPSMQEVYDELFGEDEPVRPEQLPLTKIET